LEEDLINIAQENYENYNSAYKFDSPQTYHEVDSNQAAVILEEPEESADYKINNQVEPQTTVSDDVLNAEGDLVSLIISTLQHLRTKQLQIDNGTYKKTGPGRTRKYGPKTSTQLRSLVIEYLRENFSKIISNKRCKDRKDALITIFIRSLKKLTYYLVEKTAAKNMYKKNDMSKYVVAFSESHSSFLFSINKFDDCDLLKSFVEYMVIYFPLDKARELIKSLMKQSALSNDFLKVQYDILGKREVTSKKNIKAWTDNSPTFREIFVLALEVLEEPKFAKSKVGSYLVQVTKHFLESE
jgi:hypothetical protein